MVDILLVPNQLKTALDRDFTILYTDVLIIFDEVETSISNISFVQWKKPSNLFRITLDKKRLLPVPVEVYLCCNYKFCLTSLGS